jgi:NADH-quinone oxidoreductase subunit J
MSVDIISFFILAVASIVSAIIVITRRSPIMSVVFLVLNFIILAIIYLTLQAQFIAVIQIVVYAGAIMVLFLFVILLLNLGNEELLSEKFNYKKKIALALSVVFLVQLIAGVKMSFGEYPNQLAPSAEQIGTVEYIGKVLFINYLFPFEITSLLLLAAIVGAVILSKRKV